MNLQFRAVLTVVLFIARTGVAQYMNKNKGESISTGDFNRGQLINGYLLPKKGKNFNCFSWFSYYVLKREYVNSKVYRTLLSSYEEMESLFPGRTFVYMETAKRKGGRPFPHRTHQNGLSVDLMCPLTNSKGRPKYYNALGFGRYLLSFDKAGRCGLNSNVKIDFDIVAVHILSLQKHAKKNNLRISKVIFSTDLKDELYSTESGQRLKASGIYFAQQLTPVLDEVHDDHYHVDFGPLK